MKKIISEKQVFEEADPSPESVALKHQLREALNENQSLKSRVGDDIALFDYIKGEVQALPPYRRIKNLNPKKSAHSEHHAVFIVTDAHSEEAVKSEEMEGAASYDFETFESRMDVSADKVIEITTMMRQSVPVTECHVFYLGDWFLGQIHPVEHGFGTSKTLPLALPAAAKKVADQVMKLAAHFDKVHVWGLCGNHGRNTEKPVTKMMADRNWDMSVYLIAQMFSRAQTNVEWNIPQSIMDVANVMGWGVLLTHGNCVKRTGPEPLFAISRMVDMEHRQRRKGDRDFDYAFVGHWHDESMLHGECVICPPMIGSSQFSRYLMHQSTPPGALLYYFTEKHGRTCSWRLNL
jgi:hypothetical protein